MNKLQMLTMMAAMMAMDGNTRRSVERPKAYTEDGPEVPPKGCKIYFFDEDGEFSNEGMRKDRCVLRCVASSDKIALKKFERWKNNQNK